MSDNWIRASEISNFVYCQRAWWLQRVQGKSPTNMRELQTGRHFHQQHGRLVTQAIWARRFTYILFFLVIAFITYRILMGV
jgi:hypothetical protein